MAYVLTIQIACILMEERFVDFVHCFMMTYPEIVEFNE